MTTLSIVIPTLNEAERLPALLDALQAQVLKPSEVIVADAGSKDGTAEVARAHGAIVVNGGRPGPGRNAGARAAGGDLIFFLDADVMPRPGFLARAVGEFEDRGLAVATTGIEALEDDPTNEVLAETTNLYLQVVQGFSPHAPGFCILVRRAVHEKIGGFDEQVKLAEDHEYVQRAAKHGPFEVLADVQLPVSMRRLEKEGLTKLAFKYLWCEIHALAGKPIYSTPFEYEFGTFKPSTGKLAHSWRLIDIGQLREQLGRFENPIAKLSEAGRNRLEKLADADWLDKVRDRFQPKLERPDLDALRVYLDRRLKLLKLAPRRGKAAGSKTPAKEGIRLLDLNWVRSRASRRGKDS